MKHCAIGVSEARNGCRVEVGGLQDREASGRNPPYSPALGCPEELALGKSQRSGVWRGFPSVLVGLTKVGRFRQQQALLP